MNNSNPKNKGGPRSACGKARSSLNSIKHGLRAKKVLLPSESVKEFNSLLMSIQQGGENEGLGKVLVEQVCIATWRLQRLYRLECRMLENQILQRSHQKKEDIFFDTSLSNENLDYEAEGLAYSLNTSMDTFVKYNEMLERSLIKNINLLLKFREKK